MENIRTPALALLGIVIALTAISPPAAVGIGIAWLIVEVV